MLAILNSLNAHNFLIFQLILMILVSKFMFHRALSDKAYLYLGLLSPLRQLKTGFTVMNLHQWIGQPTCSQYSLWAYRNICINKDEYLNY